MTEETWRLYNTSERGGRYESIRNDLENDAIQIYTDEQIPQGEYSELNIRRSIQNGNKPNRYGSIPYRGNFGCD